MRRPLQNVLIGDRYSRYEDERRAIFHSFIPSEGREARTFRTLTGVDAMPRLSCRFLTTHFGPQAPIPTFPQPLLASDTTCESSKGLAAGFRLAVELRTRREVDFRIQVEPDHVASLTERK